MKKVIALIANSTVIQILITLITYIFYGLVMGISLIPSVYLVIFTFIHYTAPSMALYSIALFCVSIGLAVYLYFIIGVVVMGLVIRILSLGIKPGKYPRQSLVMIRWLICSGVYHMAGSTILNYIPMTYFTTLFFKLMGAKIGRNVYINTWNLNDAYLMNIADNVVIGGKSDLSCHTFERDHLLLYPITIGEGTLIGTRCYINPGVTIGKHCLLGIGSVIRKHTNLPDRTKLSTLPGMDMKKVIAVENLRDKLNRLNSEINKIKKASLDESV